MNKKKYSLEYNKFYNWATKGYKLICEIERSKSRIVKTNEIFTNLDFVLYGLELSYPEDYFKDSKISYSDTCAGEGVWLVGFALKRMQFGMSHHDAVQNLYAVELMPDNREAMIIRLMCGDESLKEVLEKNIVCADSLKYHYRFDGTDVFDKEKHFTTLFEEINSI